MKASKLNIKTTFLNNLPIFIYEHDGYIANICHKVKDNDLLAIDIIAKNLASKINKDCVIIPAPQHTGRAEYTLSIAKKIKDILDEQNLFSVSVSDILVCNPHVPLYDQKKLSIQNENQIIGKLDIGNLRILDSHKKPFLPAGKKLFFLDNVLATGTTFNAVKKIFPKIEPLVFAVTPSYIELHEENKQLHNNKKHKRLDYDIER